MALTLCAIAGPLVAQPKKERMTYSWMMQLRHQLWLECRGASDELLESVAKDLGSDGAGNPFVPMARALARVRGVEPDPAFVFRACVQCIATPEVVDLDRYDQLNLTMHTPYRPPEGAARGFIWWMRGGPPDGGGGGGALGRSHGVYDLLRYQTRMEVDVSEHRPGDYAVEVKTRVRIGEETGPSRDADPIATARFEVIPGYPKRVDALRERVDALPEQLSGGDWLTVQAALARVMRAYTGEPRDGRASASEDLAEAEAVVDNVAAGRPALAGLTGWKTLGVACDDGEAALLTVRLPEGDPGDGRGLVVFVPGAPAWDESWSRPTSPAATSPQWLRDVLDDHGFDPEHQWLVAVMESPGRVAAPERALISVVTSLRDRFGINGVTALVGERDGASAVTRALALDPALSSGFALVAGGALSATTAGLLSGARAFVAPCRYHPANVNLARAAELLREAGATVDLASSGDRPWQLAVPLLLPQLEPWLAELR